jgi:hypothetical protein
MKPCVLVEEWSNLRAFHGKPEIKKKYLARVDRHRRADQIVKGQYWEDGKGCAVGCTLHSSNHASYETELGIPRILARLEDGIFEGLPNDEAMLWPGQFLEAIPVGARLDGIWPQFGLFLLSDPQDGLIVRVKSDEAKKSIQGTIELYQRWIAGEKPSATEWREKVSSAWEAWRAARGRYWSARAAAAAAAAAEAEAAEAAEAAAAEAAAAAAAARWSIYYQAREQARSRQAKKLLELLAAAPVPTNETRKAA